MCVLLVFFLFFKEIIGPKLSEVSTNSQQRNLIVNRSSIYLIFQFTRGGGGFLMGTYLSSVPPVTQKQGCIKWKHLDVKLFLLEVKEENNPSNILVESNCSPRCLPCQPFVIVFTVMNHSDLFESAPKLPSPTLCFKCWVGGKQQLGVCS